MGTWGRASRLSLIPARDSLSKHPDRYGQSMTTRKSNPSGVHASLDLNTLLASVEAAPPIDATEVVAAALTDALGARDVSFLIADYSGRSLIRLSHVRRTNADDDDVNRERGQAVPLAGTPHGRALAEQEVQTIGDADGFRVFAPVTSRGEAVGVLELGLRQRA